MPSKKQIPILFSLPNITMTSSEMNRPQLKRAWLLFFDYDEAMAAAKEQGKPLMIDFTGIVCPNCREFENRVWTQPEVMDRMKNKFVVASLFEDFTRTTRC
jgi:thiol:disulfide interchange protein